MKKCAFFDRDGVINYDSGYVYKKEDFLFCEGVFELLDFLKQRDYLLIVVTNQSGIARGYYTQEQLDSLHQFMQEELRKHIGFCFDKIYFCPHLPQQNCQCRKPKIGMIQRACKDYSIDIEHSLLIGDKITDMQCAQNAKIVKKFLLNNDSVEIEIQGLEIENMYRVQNVREVKDILLKGGDCEIHL